jgi:hypothetical protein
MARVPTSNQRSVVPHPASSRAASGVAVVEDRRRAPRVEVLGKLPGEVTSVDAPVSVREISLGGMAMESPVAFEVGARHSFQLTLGDGATVQLVGVVRHCRHVGAQAGGHYVVGIQFLDEPSAGDGPVGDLIGKIK